MGENDNSSPSWKGEAVIAIAIPIIGYAIAFISEFSYFNYFKIPSDLIEISFSNLFNSLLICIMTLLFMFYFSLIIFHKNKDYFETNKNRIFIVYIIPILSVIIFCLSLYLYRRKNYEILFIIFFILIIFIAFIVEFFKYVKQHEKFPSVIFFLVLVMSVLLITLFINGERNAITQKDYFILKSSPERIIVRMYKDISIVAPFDRANKIIDPTYSILKTPEITFPIILERIGEMKVKSQIENVNAGKSDKKIETKKK